MRETNKAKVAFEHYFFLGPSRSIRKLHQTYILPTSKNPPTKQLRTLLGWSTEHKWQSRVAHREAEIAAARLQEIIENAPKTGYAIWQKRVHDLGRLAEKLNGLVSIPGLFSPALVREYRGLLGDIAAEMGERPQKVELGSEGGGPLTIRVIYGVDSKAEEAA